MKKLNTGSKNIHFSNACASVVQSDGVKELNQGDGFLHSTSLNYSVYHLDAFESHPDSYFSRNASPFIINERAKPISDFGVKIGCFVTAIQLSFHAIYSICFERGMKMPMIKQPIKTWKLAYRFAPALMRKPFNG
ncbi:MAG: hypothetical protein K2Q33_09260 [Gammaproteobacteria bacterium]|nr:hypothetical protein [Gammaproteobacteria bacterium]